MKYCSLKFKVALVTFVLGLISVWGFYAPSTKNDLSNVRDLASENTNAISKIKFYGISRGCGRDGYSQEYKTNDGQRLFEGSWKVKRKEFQKRLNDIQIIVKSENAKNRYDKEGLRIIAKIIGTDGKEYFQILWYGDETLMDITAQNLELALEFEKQIAYAY